MKESESLPEDVLDAVLSEMTAEQKRELILSVIHGIAADASRNARNEQLYEVLYDPHSDSGRDVTTGRRVDVVKKKISDI